MEGLLALAVIVERLVETFCAPLWKQNHWPPIYQMYIAVAVGLVITLTGRLNALAFMPGMQTLPPVAGYIITGFLIGGGSSLLHEALAKKSGSDG